MQSLDKALEHCVADLIAHLNKVQYGLRSLAAMPEQCAPYEDELELCGKINDDLRGMSELFDDLRSMQFDLVSEPSTPEEKIMLREWKLQRKQIEKEASIAHAQRMKEDRDAAKAQKKAMKESESKMMQD
jgi:hypothetical protein